MNTLPIVAASAGLPAESPTPEPGDGFAEAMAAALGAVPAATAPTPLPSAPHLSDAAAHLPTVGAHLPTALGSDPVIEGVVPMPGPTVSLGDAIAGIVVPFLPGASPVPRDPTVGAGASGAGADSATGGEPFSAEAGDPASGAVPDAPRDAPTAVAADADPADETAPGVENTPVPSPTPNVTAPPGPVAATPETEQIRTGSLAGVLSAIPERASDTERVERSAPRVPDGAGAPEGSVEGPAASPTTATTEPTPQTSPGGTSPALLHRIEETIRRLEQGPPPRTITLDLDELGVGRLTVSVHSDGIRLAAADGAVIPASLLAELENALESRGFDLAGDDRGRSRDDENDESNGWRPEQARRSGRPHDDTSIRL